jgi:hypothetical protein
MKNDIAIETGKTSRKKGCLIAVLVALAVLFYVFWSVGEPGRRARRVHEAIRPGISYSNVEGLLTGRYYCLFQVSTNEQWQTLSRDEFIHFLAASPCNTNVATRLQLHFMGTAPLRASFFVYLDNKGIVTNLTMPYGWE